MTITVPTWIVYTLYVIGGALALAATAALAVFAIIGYKVTCSFGKRRR